MASPFTTFSKDKLLAVNGAATLTNTKKETKFGLSVLAGEKKKIFLLNLQQNHKKMISTTLSIETYTNSNCRLLFTKKFLFDFYPTDLVNTKTTIPLRVG